MRKILFLSVCMCMAFVARAQDASLPAEDSLVVLPQPKVYKTFVRDDHTMHYCTHKGITLVVGPTEGDVFEPFITIVNESGHEFLFEPRKIKAVNQRGDTLKIYSMAKYQSRQENHMFWSNFFGELAISLFTEIGASDEEREEAGVRRAIRMEEDEQERRQEVARISHGYWRSNTIFNRSEHTGFIGIKPKGETSMDDTITLLIPVDGELFTFTINHY